MYPLGWAIISLLKVFLNAMESVLDAVYSFGGFIFNDKVTGFMNALQPITTALFTLSLLFYFLCVFFNTIDDKSRIIKNILLITIIFCALTQVMTWMSTATMSASKNLIFADSQITTEDDLSLSSGSLSLEDLPTADQIIYGNTYDLLYMQETGQFASASAFKNADSHIKYSKALIEQGIDPTEKLWKNDYDDDLFHKYLKYDANGNPELGDVEDWWIPIPLFQNCYYRYHVDFWPVVIELVFMSLALLFASYKTARIIFELAISRFMAPFIGAADVHDGKRIKELIKCILTSFATIFIIAVLLRFFLFATQFIAAQDWHGWIKALLVAFLALATIDGPNFIERIIGIDAGLSSASRSIMGAIYGVQSAARGAGAAVRTGKRAVSGAAHVTRSAGHTAAKFTPKGRAMRYTEKEERRQQVAGAKAAHQAHKEEKRTKSTAENSSTKERTSTPSSEFSKQPSATAASVSGKTVGNKNTENTAQTTNKASPSPSTPTTSTESGKSVGEKTVTGYNVSNNSSEKHSKQRTEQQSAKRNTSQTSNSSTSKSATNYTADRQEKESAHKRSSSETSVAGHTVERNQADRTEEKPKKADIAGYSPEQVRQTTVSKDAEAIKKEKSSASFSKNILHNGSNSAIKKGYSFTPHVKDGVTVKKSNDLSGKQGQQPKPKTTTGHSATHKKNKR